MIRSLWGRVPSGRGFTVAAAVATAAAAGFAAWGATRSGGSTDAASTTYQVSGTAVQPAASGSLSYDAMAQRAVLTVRNLRQLDSGGAAKHQYEVWLVPGSGAPVPAGFLTRQPDGMTWTAVLSGKVQMYRNVVATVEPAGGSPEPTGDEVLNANIDGG